MATAAGNGGALTFGRLPSPPDQRDFRLAAFLPGDGEAGGVTELPRSYVPYSRTLPVYDQRDTPHCVGYSSALLATIDQRRDRHRTLIYDADELYARCKEIDGIPNLEGTYPRVACKIRHQRGAKVQTSRIAREIGTFDEISAYAALTNLDEIKLAIHYFGGALLGSTWYAEWFDVDTDATLDSTPREPVGGHAYAALGWSDRRAALLIQNSWGPNWGYTIGGTPGRAWLPYSLVRFDDFEAWRTIDQED